MRLLWSLPKAAPALLRHLVAYVDLVYLDLAKAQRELSSQFIASVIVAVCALFAVFTGCLAVVAWTWDTPYRLMAIGSMAGTFVVATIAAVIYRSNTLRAREKFLGSVGREWQQDRALLEHILSSNQD